MGGGWPAAHVRLEMLEEAVGVIRSLLAGENVNHHGVHFDLEPSGNSCYRGTRDS